MVVENWYSNVTYLRTSLFKSKDIVVYLIRTHNAPNENKLDCKTKSRQRKTYATALISLLLCGCLQEKHPPNGVSSVEDVARVRNRVIRICADVKERPLTPLEHGSWQVLHGVLAYGKDFEIELATKSPADSIPQVPEPRQSALQYLLSGGELSGWDFAPGEILPNGRRGLRSTLAPGSYSGQGHRDQWFAVLAQANLSLEQQLTVEGEQFSMDDLLQQTMLDVANNREREFSWTLIGLTKYKPTTSKWVASDGSAWSIEKLVGYELDSDLHTSACGGSHRLIGIAMSLAKRQEEGADIHGIWQQASERLRKVADFAQVYQNSDGSFSSHYFERPGVSADNATVLATTGHTLELLALTLSPQELAKPWVLRAANRLCQLLEDSKGHPLECGALYHAIHGLQVFQERTKVLVN